MDSASASLPAMTFSSLPFAFFRPAAAACVVVHVFCSAPDRYLYGLFRAPRLRVALIHTICRQF